MESIWDSILSGQGLLLLITLVVFAIAAYLVLRSLIGFVITSVMLFVAITCWFLISNNTIIHKIFYYENHALAEHQVITPTSIKDAVIQVYELARTGMCTETIKVVYAPQAVDNLDEVITRLQQQQDQLQTMIKNLRNSLPKAKETAEINPQED